MNHVCAEYLSSTLLLHAGKTIVGEYDPNVDYCEGIDRSILPKAGKPPLDARMEMHHDMVTDLAEAMISLREEYIRKGDRSAETRALLSKLSFSTLGLQVWALDHKWAAARSE